jgi:hypothetical protein
VDAGSASGDVIDTWTEGESLIEATARSLVRGHGRCVLREVGSVKNGTCKDGDKTPVATVWTAAIDDGVSPEG